MTVYTRRARCPYKPCKYARSLYGKVLAKPNVYASCTVLVLGCDKKIIGFVGRFTYFLVRQVDVA